MRIVLDLQGCQTEGSRTRGIGRYSLALAQAMIRRGTDHEFWILLNAAFRESVDALRTQFDGLVPQHRIACFHVPPGSEDCGSPPPWRSRCGEVIRRYAIRQLHPDFVHISSLFEGFTDDSVTLIDPAFDGAPTAVTVYDLIPLLHAERELPHPVSREWYMRKLESLGRAALLLGISGSACAEAESALSARHGRIVNMSSAADPRMFRPGPAGDTAARLGLKRSFVMYTGGANWRKNLEGLVQAYAQLPARLLERHQLALVCHADAHVRTAVGAVARRAGLGAEDVVFTGFVTDEDLADLYRSCALFVFPSLHEGFGLPALEAMMCGAPVIGSNASSIPEVIGREDALFDPKSPGSMAALMLRALEDGAFRAQLEAHAPVQAARFSWENTARRALEAMQEIHAGRPAVRTSVDSSVRPRLAMHAPVPPQESGIAEYTCELVKTLRAHYEIELITDQRDHALPPDLDGVAVRSTSWFRQNPSRYDRIVYQFGNSVLHAHMLALLRDHPGTVVLHDFYLSGLFNWMDSLGIEPGIFDRELFGSHGPGARGFERAHGREAAVQHYPVNRFVLERATGIIVHSDFARNAADHWYGAGYAREWKRLRHLRALPAQVDRAQARRLLGIEAGDLLVCSFGHAIPSKMNDRVLRAWMRSALARRASARFVLVGKNTRPPYGDEIMRLIRANPDQFSITGFCDKERYHAFLGAADIALQLRMTSRGETSGAVLDALAYGVPLIANANGTMAEYPADIMCRLPDEFDDDELVEALDRLATDTEERRRLSLAGREWIRRNHDPVQIGAGYRDAIEAFAVRPHRPEYWELVPQIAQLGPPASEDDLVAAAIATAATQLSL